MPRELHGPNSNVPRPAPVALSPTNAKAPYTRDYLMSPANTSDSPPSPHDSADALRKPSDTAPSTATGQSVSFFDVGGLLGSGEPRHGSSGTTAQDFAFTGPRTPGLSRPTQDTLSDLGGNPSPTRTRSRRVSGTRERSRSRPAQSREGQATSQRQREDSNTLSLQDIGGLLGGSLPNQSRREQAEPISPTTRAPASSLPPDSSAPSLPPSTTRRHRPDSENMNLQDVGGLSK
jgi:hypothetical protein